MAAMVGAFVFYLIFQVILLTVAVAVGSGLCWCIPDLSIGHGILIGMVSSIACGYFLVQIVRVKRMEMLEGYLDEQTDEDEDDESAEADINMLPLTKRRRRSRKR